MTPVPQAALSGAETALAAALGADAVITAAADLDEYTAATYWPALAAKAAGEPIPRPDVVVRPRTEEDVATVPAVAGERRDPVVPWGGGSGTQGGDALHRAVRVPYSGSGLQLRMHLSHRYLRGTMIFGRSVVPDGGPDALALHDRIWDAGMTAALAAGAVINDHNGVGLELGPYMRAQHGPALDTIRLIKGALDPHAVMNPGKLGL